MNPAYSGGTLSQFGEGILRGSGAEGQNRTVDTSLFRAVLCQLSYLGTEGIRSFSAGLFPSSRDQSTPRASYQGRTSDFHMFCARVVSSRHTTWYEFPLRFATNAMRTQGKRFMAWSEDLQLGIRA